MFIYNALDEVISCGDTSIMSNNMRKVMGTLAKTTSRGMTGYQEQFQVTQVTYSVTVITIV